MYLRLPPYHQNVTRDARSMKSAFKTECSRKMQFSGKRSSSLKKATYFLGCRSLQQLHWFLFSIGVHFRRSPAGAKSSPLFESARQGHGPEPPDLLCRPEAN